MKGIIGIICLVLAVIATLEIVKSGKDTGKKVIWLLVVWLLPIIGVILYYVVGKKQ